MITTEDKNLKPYCGTPQEVVAGVNSTELNGFGLSFCPTDSSNRLNFGEYNDFLEIQASIVTLCAAGGDLWDPEYLENSNCMVLK
jgi:hypothetical protein